MSIGSSLKCADFFGNSSQVERVAAPLTKLLQKGQLKILAAFDELLSRNFDNIILATSSKQLLTFSRFNVPFVLNRDASDYHGGYPIPSLPNEEHKPTAFLVPFAKRALKKPIVARETLLGRDKSYLNLSSLHSGNVLYCMSYSNVGKMKYVDLQGGYQKFWPHSYRALWTEHLVCSANEILGVIAIKQFTILITKLSAIVKILFEAIGANYARTGPSFNLVITATIAT